MTAPGSSYQSTVSIFDARVRVHARSDEQPHRNRIAFRCLLDERVFAEFNKQLPYLSTRLLEGRRNGWRLSGTDARCSRQYQPNVTRNENPLLHDWLPFLILPIPLFGLSTGVLIRNHSRPSTSGLSQK